MVDLDNIEAIQIDLSVVPYKINALNGKGFVVKDWSFLDRDKCWEAFYEIHNEWWRHKKKQGGLEYGA